MFSCDSNSARNNRHGTFSDNIIYRDTILQFCFGTSVRNKNWHSRRNLYRCSGYLDY